MCLTPLEPKVLEVSSTSAMTRVGNKRKLGAERDCSDWDHSSVVERFFDTEKVAGSVPVGPTFR